MFNFLKLFNNDSVIVQVGSGLVATSIVDFILHNATGDDVEEARVLNRRFKYILWTVAVICMIATIVDKD